MATADFQATTGYDSADTYWWIEIEGIRRRYSTYCPSWNVADSGTNRHIQDYLETKPSIAPQTAEPLNGSTTAFEFTVQIVDIDDELTDLFSVFDSSTAQSTLDEDVTAGEVGIDVADATDFSIGDDFFVGRETMRITNKVGNTLTVTRGMYGSTDTDHDDGDPCFNKQPFMHTREVILYENRRGLLEADAIKIRGYLESADESGGVWTLSCAGMLRRMNVKIGESLARSTLKGILWDGNVQMNSEEWQMLEGPVYSNVIVIGSATDFQTTGHVLIDKELIKYVSKVTSDSTINNLDGLCLHDSADDFSAHWDTFDVANRGLLANEILGSAGFETKIRSSGGTYVKSVFHTGHTPGTEVREVIHSDAFTAGTGPAAVILQLLLSQDGDGGNDATYDTLPTGWGAGIDASLIDITGIENACKDPPLDGFDFAPFVIPEPVDCKDWLEENILRPCHLFFSETDAGQITVNRLYNRNEAITLTTPTALTQNDLLELPTCRLGYPFGEFKVNMNYHPGDNECYGTIVCKLSEGNKYYQGGARNFEIDCKTLYDSRIGISKAHWTSADTGDLPSFLSHYLGTIWHNYALKPIPIVSFSVAYNRLYDVQVGQVITLTSSTLPDVRNADRGVNAEYFQIVETGPNPDRSCIDCVAWMIGANDQDTRLLAPAAKVKSWDGVNHRATLYDTTFTDGILYTYDIDAFSVTDDVMMVNSKYEELAGVAPEHAAITAIHDSTGNDDGYLEFAGNPTVAPGDGDYVVTGNYNNCTATQKAKWAYLADASHELGAAADEAVVRGR